MSRWPDSIKRVSTDVSVSEERTLPMHGRDQTLLSPLADDRRPSDDVSQRGAFFSRHRLLCG